jgi:transcriptional regulator of nitric oxide reductase
VTRGKSTIRGQTEELRGLLDETSEFSLGRGSRGQREELRGLLERILKQEVFPGDLGVLFGGGEGRPRILAKARRRHSSIGAIFMDGDFGDNTGQQGKGLKILALIREFVRLA